MKDKFVFYGINSPLRKEIFKEHKKKYGFIPESEKDKIVRWCWAAPEREYQYFAMDLLGSRQETVNPEIIDLYEFMITTKSWWDTVDFIASHLVGSYFKKYPEKIKQVTGNWMKSGNFWLQRNCLLFQHLYL